MKIFDQPHVFDMIAICSLHIAFGVLSQQLLIRMQCQRLIIELRAANQQGGHGFSPQTEWLHHCATCATRLIATRPQGSCVHVSRNHLQSLHTPALFSSCRLVSLQSCGPGLTADRSSASLCHRIACVKSSRTTLQSMCANVSKVESDDSA